MSCKTRLRLQFVKNFRLIERNGLLSTTQLSAEIIMYVNEFIDDKLLPRFNILYGSNKSRGQMWCSIDWFSKLMFNKLVNHAFPAWHLQTRHNNHVSILFLSGFKLTHQKFDVEFELAIRRMQMVSFKSHATYNYWTC